MFQSQLKKLSQKRFYQIKNPNLILLDKGYNDQVIYFIDYDAFSPS